MKDTMEQRLADDLHQVGTATSVPRPPLAALVRAGRHRVRRNRALSVAAGVAAVCVVMTGVTFGPRLLSADDPAQPVHPGPSKVHHTPGTKVRTLDDLPQGAAPRTPYWHDGVLHVAGASFPTPLRDIVTAGPTTFVSRWTPVGVRDLSLVVGDHLVPVPGSQGSDILMVSPDGRTLVWETIHPDVTRLTAWDVTAHAVVAVQDVRVHQPDCCGGGPAVLMYGADNHGQVFYGGGRGLTVWKPATGATHSVTGLGHLPPGPSQVEASGPVFQSMGRWTSDEGVFGTVDDAGVFHRAGSVPTDQAGTWSPDGTLFAYAGDDSGNYVAKVIPTTVTVLDVATGRTHEMQLPSGVTGALSWESNGTLLVRTGTGEGRHDVVRCDAGTGACELALRVGSLRGWSFPERS